MFHTKNWRLSALKCLRATVSLQTIAEKSRMSCWTQISADGCDRIYVHGEKSNESRIRGMREGISLNEKTYDEMKMIGLYTGAIDILPEYLD